MDKRLRVLNPWLLIILISAYIHNATAAYPCTGVHDVDGNCWICVNNYYKENKQTKYWRNSQGLAALKAMKEADVCRSYEQREVASVDIFSQGCGGKQNKMKVECKDAWDKKYQANVVAECEQTSTRPTVACYSKCYPSDVIDSGRLHCSSPSMCANDECGHKIRHQFLEPGLCAYQPPTTSNSIKPKLKQGKKLYCTKANFYREMSTKDLERRTRQYQQRSDKRDIQKETLKYNENKNGDDLFGTLMKKGVLPSSGTKSDTLQSVSNPGNNMARKHEYDDFYDEYDVNDVSDHKWIFIMIPIMSLCFCLAIIVACGLGIVSGYAVKRIWDNKTDDVEEIN